MRRVGRFLFIVVIDPLIHLGQTAAMLCLLPLWPVLVFIGFLCEAWQESERDQ